MLHQSVIKKQVHFEVHHPVLVCTYTNVAVDNLVEGFVAAGLKPLRIGSVGKVKPSLSEHTIAYKLAKHPLGSKFDSLLEEQKVVERRRVETEKKIADSQREAKPNASKRLEHLRSALIMRERQSMSIKSRLYALHQEMLRDLMSAADVVSVIIERSFLFISH